MKKEFMFTKLKKKFKAIRQILKYDNFDLSLVLSPEDEFKIILSNEIKAIFRTKNIEEQAYLENAIDRIHSKIFKKKSIEQFSNESIDSYIASQMWYYSSVAGLACIWELKVKLLAEKFGINIKKSWELRNNKQKNTKMVVFDDLKNILPKLNKITKQFNLRLKEISQIKSSLSHTNLDQLRILLNNCATKIKTQLKGNVLLLNTSLPSSAKRIQSLSDDDMDQYFKEEQSIYSWFMEVTNSRALPETMNILSDSIKKINLISEFLSISFAVERKYIFDKLVLNNGSITNNDIEKYQKYFESSVIYRGCSANKYFYDLNKVFKRDIMPACMKPGQKVKIKKKDNRLNKRKNKNGIIVRRKGNRITVKPMWCKWVIELYPCEFTLLKD